MVLLAPSPVKTILLVKTIGSLNKKSPAGNLIMRPSALPIADKADLSATSFAVIPSPTIPKLFKLSVVKLFVLASFSPAKDQSTRRSAGNICAEAILNTKTKTAEKKILVEIIEYKLTI